MKTKMQKLNEEISSLRNERKAKRLLESCNRAEFNSLPKYAIEAARYIGAEPSPMFAWAVEACIEARTRFEFVAEVTSEGNLRRGGGRVAARWAVWKIMRRRGMSFPEIAACFGGSHTSVVSACHKGFAA